ncbi:glycosyltransferase family 4 protein [Streptomyces sp. NPDC005480]|uniref:glycosyltransferase family 4 protein n=1 Tax=Streptomyces sp. NPDC005480 TaxID=3154880 RepID=UPI0033AF445C
MFCPQRAPRPRVTFVTPMLSEFRHAFFRRLAEDLADVEVDLTVAHGRPYNSDMSSRADAVDMEGAVQLPQFSLRVGGRPLVYKRLGPLFHSSDVLVVDQALRNVELYPQLIRQRLGRGPVISMWDHGRTYSKPQSQREQQLKFAFTRQARWFFAYTEGGARSVVEHGFPQDRTTVVQNSIDTTAVRKAYEQVTSGQLARIRDEYDLTPGRTALYIGAISSTKRIRFLLEAADAVARLLPGFRLLVAGQGEEMATLQAWAARSAAVVPVGQAFGERKALLGAAAEVLLMPGLVGLCAVDSFALETPVVTTQWPYHGPEFEYLEDGRNALVAPDDPEQYAACVAELLGSPERLDAMRRECREDARRYTVEEMSRRFTDGLVRLLGDGRR